MRKLSGLVVLFPVLYATAQSPAGSTDPLTAVKDSAALVYYSTRGETLPLYNGRQFSGGYSDIKGSAFYAFSDWQNGSVQYEGTWYYNIPVMYDVYRDEVIVRHSNGTSFILLGDRVQQFKYGGKSFVRLHSGSSSLIKTGYYEVLGEGKLTVFAKRSRILEESIQDLKVEKQFISRTRYFALKDNRYHQFSKQRQLLDIIKEGRNSIQQDLKDKDLSFKSQPEVVIARIAEFYNQSNK